MATVYWGPIMQQTLCGRPPFIHTVSRRAKICPHFIDAETEAQRREAGCPRSPSRGLAEGGFRPTDSSSLSPAVTMTDEPSHPLVSARPDHPSSPHVLSGPDTQDQKVHASKTPASRPGEPDAEAVFLVPSGARLGGPRVSMASCWSTGSAPGPRDLGCPQ